MRPLPAVTVERQVVLRARHRGGRRHPAWPAVLLLAALAACAGPESGTSPASPATPAAYPDLARVPARPRLGYTVEQRRELSSGLVADRANARYREAALAYATGRTDTAPTAPPSVAATPAPAAAPAPAPATPGAATVAASYVDSSLDAASDDGDLNDFMKRIDRNIPDPYGPATVTQLVGIAPQPPLEPAPTADAGNGDSGGFGGFLGGLLGVEDPPAARP